MVGSIPMEVKAQIWTGTMMNPPPTPSRPLAKPTTMPVASKASKYKGCPSAIKAVRK
jgi:hypothetical protein